MSRIWPKLLVTGGVLRDDAKNLGEGRRYGRGRLVHLDHAKNRMEVLCELGQGNENYPEETPNLLFTSATLDNGKLYLCSETEIFVYSYPDFRLERSASYPFFQNIHHISPIKDSIFVASTGLDLIAQLDRDTLEVVNLYNAMGKDPWHRFSPDEDYRKMHSTKPHEAHPNFVFEMDEKVWATRFQQSDAVCLTDAEERIDVGIERIHDGHVIEGKIYFTAVDGKIIVVDAVSRTVSEVVDLNRMEKNDCPLGWCRGLAVVGDVAYVGFSRIRETALKENLLWMMRWSGRPRIMPARVAAYDLRRHKKIGEFVLGGKALDAIYGVIAIEN